MEQARWGFTLTKRNQENAWKAFNGCLLLYMLINDGLVRMCRLSICTANIPKDIPSIRTFKIHYVNIFPCHFYYRYQHSQWIFLPAFQLDFFPHHSAFIILNQTHTFAQNINKSSEIKRFRCFFLCVSRCLDCLQKRRNLLATTNGARCRSTSIFT